MIIDFFFFFFAPLVKWQQDVYLNHLCTLDFCTVPLISTSNPLLLLKTPKEVCYSSKTWPTHETRLFI